jgi:hypothetical protein
MPNIVIQQPATFPNGTSVSAYPASAQRSDGGPPAAVALETQVVASDAATFTTLSADTAYAFYAAANGRWHQQRITSVQSTDRGQAVASAVTTTSGSPTLTSVTLTSGRLEVGQRIAAAGVPSYAVIRDIPTNNTVTMSEKATASATVPATFDGSMNTEARRASRRAAAGAV